MHDPWPTTENVPAGHRAGADVPPERLASRHWYPAGHCVQLTEPGPLNVPAGQTSGVWRAGRGQYIPAGHTVQFFAPSTALKFPGEQGTIPPPPAEPGHE